MKWQPASLRMLNTQVCSNRNKVAPCLFENAKQRFLPSQVHSNRKMEIRHYPATLRKTMQWVSSTQVLPRKTMQWVSSTQVLSKVQSNLTCLLSEILHALCKTCMLDFNAVRTIHLHKGTAILHIVIPFNTPHHRYNLIKLDKSRWLISNVNEQTVILLHSVNIRY